MRGKPEEALKLLENLGEEGKAYAAVRNKAGVCLAHMGRLSEAEAEFRAAISIDSENSQAYTNLGNIYKERGDLLKAQEYYERAIQADPTYPNAYHNLGVLYMNEGKYDKAIPMIKTGKQLELGKGDIRRGRRRQYFWRYSWVAIAFLLGIAIILITRQK